MIATQLAEQVIDGRSLQAADEMEPLLTCDLDELGRGADLIRRCLVGAKADLCMIVNGRSGRCGEDCAYCAQSAHHPTSCEEYGLLDYQQLLDATTDAQAYRVDRLAVVTSGRSMQGQEFEELLHSYAKIHAQCKIALCASLGILTAQQLERLRYAGVSRYHHNIETSRAFFPRICTTHTFDQRIETIRAAQSVGMDVCSGGIIGMGESWHDRIDMALELARLGIGSIPVNVLTPIPGTPLQHQEPLPREDILRSVALFRYANPTAHIRLAGGRRFLPDFGREAFWFGASSTITGDMLTTASASVEHDRQMLNELGWDTTPVWEGGG